MLEPNTVIQEWNEIHLCLLQFQEALHICPRSRRIDISPWTSRWTLWTSGATSRSCSKTNQFLQYKQLFGKDMPTKRIFRFGFILNLARTRTVSTFISLYKHEWYTVYRVELLRSYFNTASSSAQAHRIYILYILYIGVYCTVLYPHTHHFECVTKIARRPSWMSGENNMRSKPRTPKF